MSNTHADHSWNLGPLGGGMVFPGGYCFKASMKYRFVPHPEGWRVTTLEYIYSLGLVDAQLWAMHCIPWVTVTKRDPIYMSQFRTPEISTSIDPCRE